MVILLWVALIAGILLVVYGFIVGGSPLGISPSVAIGGVLAFLSNYYLQRETARSQRETEQESENTQAQHAAIAAYTEKMSELVIQQKVDERSSDPHVHRVAQALTISTLVQLDAVRRKIVLQVVNTLGLISEIELVGASLDHADLTELDLRKARLRFANLRGADLHGAVLSGADLSHADLRGANLTNADLSDAKLSGANLLPYDKLDPARLSLYNLKDHALPSDDYLRFLAEQQEYRFRLRGLFRPTLLRGRVTFTNLTDTKLPGANLAGAILANADLRFVRGLTQEQIDSAIGNDKTHLPHGLHPPSDDAWTRESIEVQIKRFEAK